jgi:hypothetical protein
VSKYFRPTAASFEALLDSELLCVSRQPFLDAARVLIDRGFDPDARLVMLRGDGTASLSARLSVAARYTVEESAHGPIFRPFRSSQESAVAAPPIRFADAAVSEAA